LLNRCIILTFIKLCTAVAQQFKLAQLLSRQLALTVGRGMFTLATDIDAYVFGDETGDRLSIMTEPVPVTGLCLQGKLVGSNTTVSLEPSQVPAGSTTWPEFHNAVAAGLRIAPEQSSKISAAWLSCNKPKGEATSPAFAGILLAMGLSGHLKNIEKTKVFQYLLPWDPLTSVALLLGLASCYYGTSSST
jgi:anaphase-promoting complex subunit 1